MKKLQIKIGEIYINKNNIGDPGPKREITYIVKEKINNIWKLLCTKDEGRFCMSLLKETAIESIRRLPDECTVEDIMYRIDLVAQVYEGLNDAESGRLITTEELIERVDQWAK